MEPRRAKVWFITGASRGFGRQWTTAALRRGDNVAAAARDVGALEDLRGEFDDRLLPVKLDVRDRGTAFAAVRAADEHFGRLDVVVNNAGYGQFGLVEELTEAESRDQMETNFFGALWVTQAVLPIMRAQQSGHIVQVSSVAGLTSFPNLGIYHASKWALEGLSEALACEVAAHGIHVTLVEPALFKTDWAGTSARHSRSNEAYAAAYQSYEDSLRAMQAEVGDPHRSAAALLELVDAQRPPLRAFFGKLALPNVKEAYRRRIENWESWQQLAIDAQG
jgi:NAD(P)-dependent dehydrogenase (short-subunit alcohol dehydrogenase family)